jgi:hypothetical protein
MNTDQYSHQAHQYKVDGGFIYEARSITGRDYKTV